MKQIWTFCSFRNCQNFRCPMWSALYLVILMPFELSFRNRCQFHQHFTRDFFRRKSFTQLFSIYILFFVIFWWKNIGEKATCQMLMKLITGVPKKWKNCSKLSKEQRRCRSHRSKVTPEVWGSWKLGKKDSSFFFSFCLPSFLKPFFRGIGVRFLLHNHIII